MRRLLLALLTIGWNCFAGAAESRFDEGSQCPGKPTARADIVACHTFDNVRACNTGHEPACARANPFGSRPYGRNFHVARAPSAAQGEGYLAIELFHGDTGRINHLQLPALSTEFALRFYTRFGPGAADFVGSIDHQLYVWREGAGGCRGPSPSALIIDWGVWDDAVVIAGGCKQTTTMRGWADDLLPGRWYLIEVYGKRESVCVQPSDTTGCNGLLRVYVDGKQTLNVDNFNWCGEAVADCRFAGFYFPNTYYNAGAPRWGYTKHFDGIVIGRDADTRIGASTTERPRGEPYAGLADYPYKHVGGSSRFYFVPRGQGDCGSPRGCWRSDAGDCALWEVGGQLMGRFWGRNDPALFSFDISRSDGTPFDRNAGYPEPNPNCNGARGGIDASLRIDVPAGDTRDRLVTSSLADATGGSRTLPDAGRNVYVGGSVRFARGSDWTGSPIVLGTISRGRFCANNAPCERIGLTVADGRWSLKRYYETARPQPFYFSPSDETFCSGPVAQPNRWYAVEVGLREDGKAVLWVDDERSGPCEIPYASEVGVNIAPFIGAVRLAGGPLQMNFDNIYASTVSQRSCDELGWQADCPLIAARLGSPRRPGPAPAPRPE